MPTEKQTREAIADLIRLAAPDAVVIPRNQLGLLADGDFAALVSTSASNRLRGWIVTQSAAELIQQFSIYADYRYTWRIVQIHEYKTGNDSTNSEDTFASERDAVISAFLNPAVVSGITQPVIDDLGNMGAITFSGANSITVAPGREGGKRVHIADGSISAICKVGVCT